MALSIYFSLSCLFFLPQWFPWYLYSSWENHQTLAGWRTNGPEKRGKCVVFSLNDLSCSTISHRLQDELQITLHNASRFKFLRVTGSNWTINHPFANPGCYPFWCPKTQDYRSNLTIFCQSSRKEIATRFFFAQHSFSGPNFQW